MVTNVPAAPLYTSRCARIEKPEARLCVLEPIDVAEGIVCLTYFILLISVGCYIVFNFLLSILVSIFDERADVVDVGEDGNVEGALSNKAVSGHMYT
jgi:hypothetical protein